MNKMIAIGLTTLFLTARPAQAKITDSRTKEIADAFSVQTDPMTLSGTLTYEGSGLLKENLPCQVVFSECGGLKAGGLGSLCMKIQAAAPPHQGAPILLATAVAKASYYGGVFSDANYVNRLEVDKDGSATVFTNPTAAEIEFGFSSTPRFSKQGQDYSIYAIVAEDPRLALRGDRVTCSVVPETD